MKNKDLLDYSFRNFIKFSPRELDIYYDYVSDLSNNSDWVDEDGVYYNEIQDFYKDPKGNVYQLVTVEYPSGNMGERFEVVIDNSGLTQLTMNDLKEMYLNEYKDEFVNIKINHLREEIVNEYNIDFGGREDLTETMNNFLNNRFKPLIVISSVADDIPF